VDKKVFGFKMMMGESTNEWPEEDILTCSCKGWGTATIGDVDEGGTSGTIKKNDMESYDFPENIMCDYDRETTIMTFRFEDGVIAFDELPTILQNSKGIIMGESNLELVYEMS
jgi:hypothetical protein